MEAPEKKIVPARILRHTFFPSERLAWWLGRLTRTDQARAFELTSTHAVVVDERDHQLGRYSYKLTEAERRLSAVDASFEIRVMASRMADQALHLAFAPTDQQAFDRLTQPIDTLPTLVPHHSHTGHYMRLEIPRGQLGRGEEIQHVLRGLEGAISGEALGSEERQHGTSLGPVAVQASGRIRGRPKNISV